MQPLNTGSNAVRIELLENIGYFLFEQNLLTQNLATDKIRVNSHYRLRGSRVWHKDMNYGHVRVNNY